jgi:hypothetical protein
VSVIDFTVICENCLRSVDLRTDPPESLVGWEVVDVRDGVESIEDVTARDLSWRCPGCAS